MSNTTRGIATNPRREQEEYDSLPPPIRAVIMRAPFDYTVIGFARKWREHRKAGGTVEEYRRFLTHWICDDLQREAFKDYGPEHPDAARHRITRQPLANPPRRRRA